MLKQCRITTTSRSLQISLDSLLVSHLNFHECSIREKYSPLLKSGHCKLMLRFYTAPWLVVQDVCGREFVMCFKEDYLKKEKKKPRRRSNSGQIGCLGCLVQVFDDISYPQTTKTHNNV